MNQPGMRVTLDAAMRARDVSRPRAEGDEPPKPQAPRKAAKGERRRLGKRQAREQGGQQGGGQQGGRHGGGQALR